MKKAVITGANGFTGRYVAENLLERGWEVATLTGHPGRPFPLKDKVEIMEYGFDRPHDLSRKLEGADALFNSYWIRFNRRKNNFGRAMANTMNLIMSAKEAGVKRIVHISVTNPSQESSLPYFHYKALAEEEIKKSGLSYAILRPTMIYGENDILTNNMAWMLRKFPVFALPGRGKGLVQPVYVGDLGRLAADMMESMENAVMDAAGPETFSYLDFTRTVRAAVGANTMLIPVPPAIAWLLGRAMGIAIRDVPLTRDEIKGLNMDLLVSTEPPACPTRFSEWIRENADRMGKKYNSETARHYQ